MNERESIHELLVEIQEVCDETPHVYYQPPESVKMEYPCFRYNRVGKSSIYANNNSYLHSNTYTVMYITKNPEPEIPELLENLPKFEFDRKYSANGLNHFVFTLHGMFLWTPSDKVLSDKNKIVLGGN